LCSFSVIKSKYRAQVHELSRFDNADKVKKIGFIDLYHHARLEALTSINIKAGWRAAGLHPYNPDKALTSSLIVQASLTPQTAPKTHPRPLQLIISTPHNRRELQTTFDSIRLGESLSKSVRMLFNKTAKAFDEFHYNTAESTLLLKGQQQEIGGVTS
jgi:hypothetical protein